MAGASGLHHFEKRKRIHKKHEPYPHPDRFKRFMDRAIYVVGVALPLSSITQVTAIWIEGNAAGVSLFTWTAFLAAAIFWLIYGFMHREKPIIIMNILWIIMQVLVISGVLIYG